MWKTVKLGDICDLVGGGTPSKKNKNYYDGEIAWATVRDMHSDLVKKTEFHITELGLKNSSSNIIPKGNVIIASRVGLGKVCLLTQDTAINQDLRGVIPKKENTIDSRYLFYWFKSISKTIINAGRGATVHGVTLPFLKSLKLPLPPLAEQQRIVAKLDSAFSEIDKAIELSEKSADDAALVYSHTIDELFERYGNERVSLGSLSSINYGYTAKASQDKGTYQLLRITDIQHNTVDWTNVPYCEVEQKKLANVLLHDGDIVFARTGATTGKSFLVENPKDAVFASYLIRVSVDREKLTPRYVMHYFQSASYWQQVIEGTSGAAQGGFNASKLSELKIPLVPKDTQQALIEKLDDVLVASNQIANIHQKKSNKLSILKSAILAQELNPSEAA